MIREQDLHLSQYSAAAHKRKIIRILIYHSQAVYYQSKSVNNHHTYHYICFLVCLGNCKKLPINTFHFITQPEIICSLACNNTGLNASVYF